MQGIKKKDGLRHNASKIGLSKIHRRLILYRHASFYPMHPEAIQRGSKRKQYIEPVRFLRHD